MRCSFLGVALLATAITGSHALAQVDQSLTLDQVLRLARERSPSILSARGKIDEARGRLIGASTLLRHNPVVEAAAGPRFTDGGSTIDGEAGLSQTFELGGRRGARKEAAEASVHRAMAGSDDATRRLLRDVAVSFLRALHAADELRLLRQAETVVAEIARAVEGRFQAGEVPLLDANLAKVALARARSQVRAAEAAEGSARGELRILLGLEPGEGLAIRGDLRDRRRFELDELAARAPDRPDLKALQAEIRESIADRKFGEGAAWPDVGLGVRYERDEGDDIVLGGVSFTLPLFDRGQGQRAEASARARRLEQELRAGRRAVGVEVQVAFESYQRMAQAVGDLETDALPLLDQNETLARRSYELGQIGLIEYLIHRREIFETRALHLERLLDAALAGVELEASAGVLQ